MTASHRLFNPGPPVAKLDNGIPSTREAVGTPQLTRADQLRSDAGMPILKIGCRGGGGRHRRDFRLESKPPDDGHPPSATEDLVSSSTVTIQAREAVRSVDASGFPHHPMTHQINEGC